MCPHKHYCTVSLHLSYTPLRQCPLFAAILHTQLMPGPPVSFSPHVLINSAVGVDASDGTDEVDTALSATLPSDII